MDKDILQRIKDAHDTAASGGPDMQLARIEFYKLVWENWSAMYNTLKPEEAP